MTREERRESIQDDLARLEPNCEYGFREGWDDDTTVEQMIEDARNSIECWIYEAENTYVLSEEESAIMFTEDEWKLDLPKKYYHSEEEKQEDINNMKSDLEAIDEIETRYKEE